MGFFKTTEGERGTGQWDTLVGEVDGSHVGQGDRRTGE